jgi:hypothetical protein
MEIATIDVEVDLDEEVYMELEPALVDIAAVLDPSYKQQHRSDGGIIVKLRRAVCGTIQTAHSWHQRLSKLLMFWKFKSNPCDGCLFTRTNADEVTHVCIHVDDLLICTSGKDGITDIEEMLLSEIKAIYIALNLYIALISDSCMRALHHILLESAVSIHDYLRHADPLPIQRRQYGLYRD